MKHECPELVSTLRKYHKAAWRDIFNAANKLSLNDCCSDSYDKEIIQGFEYSLIEGKQRQELKTHERLLIFRKLLSRYFKFDSKYHRNIKDILVELSSEDSIPDWYWYFKVKFSFEASKRTLLRKQEFFSERISEYYTTEYEEPKNLNNKFSEFLDTLTEKSISDIEQNIDKEIGIAKELKRIFKKHRKPKVKDIKLNEDNSSREIIDSEKKILLMGDCSLRKDIVINFLRDYGIDRSNVDLILDFHLDGFDLNTLKNSSKYSLVIIGPTQHSVKGLNGHNSISRRMSLEEGFPKFIDLNKSKPISKEELHFVAEIIIECLN